MNKQNEALEIGSLFQELIEKGFGDLKIDVETEGDLPHLVSVWASTSDGTKSIARISTEIVDALVSIVDAIREHRGEPTGAQEVEAMLAKDGLNDGLDMRGHDACICGSKRPLIVEITRVQNLPWDSSAPYLTGDEGPEPGDIARCPDCGQHYRLA